MTPDRLDTLLAALARARTRRGMIAAAATVITAGTTARETAQAVDLAAAICLGRNERCKHKRECCSEHCRPRKGKKKRKCACTPEGERCLDVKDCCEGDVRLFCVAGFCVRER
jgi:hypothetical protein